MEHELPPVLGPSGSRNSLLRFRLRLPASEVLLRRAIAKSGVRSLAVVVLPPGRDLPPGIFEIGEDLSVQALVAEAALEGLHEGILRGFAGGREVELHASFEGPGVEGLRGEFRSVVGSDDLGKASSPGLLEKRRDPRAAEADSCLKDLA